MSLAIKWNVVKTKPWHKKKVDGNIIYYINNIILDIFADKHDHHLY